MLLRVDARERRLPLREDGARAGVGFAVGEAAGARCTGGARLSAGLVGVATTDDPAAGSSVVAGTATDALALLGALTSASNDGSPSRLSSAARSAACCFVASTGVRVRLGAGGRGVGAGVALAAVVVVVAPVAEEAEVEVEEEADAEDALARPWSSSALSLSLLSLDAADDARRSACSRASLARARLGRRCRRRRWWRWRRRGLRLRRRADEEAETDTDADADRDRRGGFRFALRARLVGDARAVRLLVVVPFPFRATGLGGGLTGRGGGTVDFLRSSARVPEEAEADVDDEADDPRLGPADADASPSVLDADVPEESERVIADGCPVRGGRGYSGGCRLA